MPANSVRFTDILTTASAVADYLGEPDVTPGHVLLAIDIQCGRKGLDDIGRPISPLLRQGRRNAGARPVVRELAQRWFAELGADVQAELSPNQLERLTTELRSLVSAS